MQRSLLKKRQSCNNHTLKKLLYIYLIFERDYSKETKLIISASMVVKKICFFLGISLVLQCSNAEKFKNIDSAHRALVERLKLMKFVETARYPLEKEYLSKGKEVMDKVLKDPKVLELQTEEMKSILDKIRAFVKEIEKYEKDGAPVKGIERHVDKLAMLTEEYGQDAKDTPEEKLMVTSLKENGIERLGESAEEKLKEFIEMFTAELEKTVDKMSDEEKREDTKIVEFLKELKTEKNTSKQDELIWKFFGWVQLDDFMW